MLIIIVFAGLLLLWLISTKTSNREVVLANVSLQPYSILEAGAYRVDVRAVDAENRLADVPGDPSLVLRAVAKDSVLHVGDVLPLNGIELPEDPVVLDVAPARMGLASSLTPGQSVMIFGTHGGAEFRFKAVVLSDRLPDESVVVAISRSDANALAPALVDSKVIITKVVE
jgi:hypothetical protein